MCLGSKSSTPQPQQPPAPNKPTTFDYNPQRNAAQQRANAGVSQAQSATLLSQTETPGAGFGSELGGVTAQQ